MSILASVKRHGIEPFTYVRQLLVDLPSDDVDLRSLLPDVWIADHPEHFLQYRHDEAEAAAHRGSGVAPNAAPSGTHRVPQRPGVLSRSDRSKNCND